LAIVMMANAASGDSRLLYAEAQAVASYSFYRHPHPDYLQEFGWYSMDQMDVMQKPSIGFDLVQRLSTETGDWGLLAVQARLAYDSTRNGGVEPQLYNAFLKVKPGSGDLWLGHNKPAFGLAMSLDNHGTLLQPLSMYGYGYDRDWGAGYYRDLESCNVAFSATLGSGMPIHAKGNYLLSGRISKGDLNQKNYNIGLSASYGKVLETMGYTVTMSGMPIATTMIGADLSYMHNRFEHRAEIIRKLNDVDHRASKYWAVMYRASMNAMSDNRLKMELQYVYDGHADELSPGITFLVNTDLTLRLSAAIRNPIRTAAQIYWYHEI
jgi:hypothetical protein